MKLFRSWSTAILVAGMVSAAAPAAAADAAASVIEHYGLEQADNASA